MDVFYFYSPDNGYGPHGVSCTPIWIDKIDKRIKGEKDYGKNVSDSGS